MPRKSRFPISRRTFVAGAATQSLLCLSAASQAAFAASPMLGVQRPNVYRFKLGNFEITNILDGYVVRKGPHPIFGQNQPEDVVQAFAKSHHLPPTQLENGYTVTLVNTGEALILFDTGNGEGRRNAHNGLLRDRLLDADYTPEQIDIVVSTHGHPDHIGGLIEGGQPAFPNARYVFGQTEFDYWRTGDNIPDRRKKNHDLYMRLAVPMAEKATFIAPGNDVVTGIRAVDAFGHSPGMLAFHIESEGRRLMLWADVTNHYVMSLMKPEWHVLFDHDKDKAIATRKRILAEVAAERIPAIGYHMPFPAIGFVEVQNDSFRWVPASYQFNL
ncbi:MAG: MBL fold metallo-hydrolase [Pseudomonadota bacterium]